MEPEIGTDPDQFEIHISDSESHFPEEDVLRKHAEKIVPSIVIGQNSNVRPHVEGKTTTEPDLLCANLSGVILDQSLQLTDRRIGLGDGDKHVAEYGILYGGSNPAQPDLLQAASPSMVQHLPVSASPSMVQHLPVSASPSMVQHLPVSASPSMVQHLPVSASPSMVQQLPASASPSMVQQLPASASSQHGEILLEDITADFEDAVDPLLLTSTLKAANEDSDDEFDFDLPTTKVDKEKTVRFSGEVDFETSVKEANVDSQKAAAKPKLSELSVQTAVPLPSGPHIQQKKEEVRSIMAGALLHGGDGPCKGNDDKQHQLEKEEEKEDRRHIITSTAADWDNVETVEAGFMDTHGKGTELMSSTPPLLSFSDIWQHFRIMDHSAVKDKIRVTAEKKGFSGFVSRLFGPPRMNKDLHADRELVFSIAATAFENRDTEHVQSLQTIYRVLTGSRFNCPRYGSHWEEIGFQGRDPATDLRGTGMLALIQLVSFLQDDDTTQLARDLYKLSLHPTQNFPFCVMCINISRITLQSLREGLLNRECNSQKKVMPVVNQFYAGILLYLYRVWQQGKTISDSGFVIKDVENRAKKQSKEVFMDLRAYLVGQKAEAQGHPAFGSTATKDSTKKDENVNFFNVVKSENKTAAELY